MSTSSSKGTAPQVPKTMKALYKKTAVPGYELVTMDVPTPTGAQTLIRVEKVGICGSDIPLYKWDAVGQSIADLPFVPGHEAVGIVVAHGPDVDRTDVAVGTRVCVENHYYCGDCYQCYHDMRHICQKMGQFGHGMGKDRSIAEQGGCAQYAVVPSRNLYPITSSISINEACLLEPFGVAHQACESAEVRKGDDLVVLGCGTVGLFAVQIAKAWGASKIIVVDIDKEKLELAKTLGANVCINGREEKDLKARVMSETEGNGIGHLIEATGAPPLVNTCFGLVRKGGNVCLVGIPKKQIVIDGNAKDFVFRNLTVRGIHGRKLFHTWIESEKLMASKAVNPEAVVSHDIPLSDYKKAFDALLSGKCMKILLNPQA